MGQFEIVCRSIPVPGAQMTLGGKLKDPSKPLRRCGDWVNEAINKLIAEGLVKCEFDACLKRRIVRLPIIGHRLWDLITKDE
jgi:hypothetical protein